MAFDYDAYDGQLADVAPLRGKSGWLKVARLKFRQGAVASSLDEFKRALLALARAELPEARFHEDHVERFDYDGDTYSSEWPEADERGWRFFRLADEGLADELVTRA